MAKPKLNPVERIPVTGIILDGDIESPCPPGIAEIVLRAWAAKGEMDAAKKRMEAANDELILALGHTSSVVIPGTCRAIYTQRESVKIADAGKLEDLLGARFLDLVTESISHKASEKLIEMAADGDDPLGPSLRALLTVTQSESVTLKAEK